MLDIISDSLILLPALFSSPKILERYVIPLLPIEKTHTNQTKKINNLIIMFIISSSNDRHNNHSQSDG
jgi:hypothetical protein